MKKSTKTTKTTKQKNEYIQQIQGPFIFLSRPGELVIKHVGILGTTNTLTFGKSSLEYMETLCHSALTARTITEHTGNLSSAQESLKTRYPEEVQNYPSTNTGDTSHTVVMTLKKKARKTTTQKHV